MAQSQTTGGMSFAGVEFFYQVEGDASETEASGFMTTVDVSGYERQVGEAYTASGDTAILTAGKTSPIEVTAKSIYTEGATDPTKDLWDAKDAKARVKFIWYPQGKTAGNMKWETDYGYLSSVTPPGGDVSSADALLTEMVLKSPKVTPSVVPES